MTEKTIIKDKIASGLFSAVKQYYLFQYVEDDQLRDFLSLFKTIHYRKGSYVFMEGDEISNFYFVVSGEVEISISNHKFSEKIFNISGPGKTVGLSEMFYCHGLHTSSALCTKDCTLAYLPKMKFRSIILDYPSITYALCVYMGNMIGRLRNEIAYSDGEIRILSYLKNYIYTGKRDADGVLHIPKMVTLDKLSKMLNITRETAGRIFKKLKEKNIAELRSKTFVILDEEKLEIAVPHYSCLPIMHDADSWSDI